LLLENIRLKIGLRDKQMIEALILNPPKKRSKKFCDLRTNFRSRLKSRLKKVDRPRFTKNKLSEEELRMLAGDFSKNKLTRRNKPMARKASPAQRAYRDFVKKHGGVRKAARLWKGKSKRGRPKLKKRGRPKGIKSARRVGSLPIGRPKRSFSGSRSAQYHTGLAKEMALARGWPNRMGLNPWFDLNPKGWHNDRLGHSIAIFRGHALSRTRRDPFAGSMEPLRYRYTEPGYPSWRKTSVKKRKAKATKARKRRVGRPRTRAIASNPLVFTPEYAMNEFFHSPSQNRKRGKRRYRRNPFALSAGGLGGAIREYARGVSFNDVGQTIVGFAATAGLSTFLLNYFKMNKSGAYRFVSNAICSALTGALTEKVFDSRVARNITFGGLLFTGFVALNDILAWLGVTYAIPGAPKMSGIGYLSQGDATLRQQIEAEIEKELAQLSDYINPEELEDAESIGDYDDDDDDDDDEEGVGEYLVPSGTKSAPKLVDAFSVHSRNEVF
jgi:hypothetical protein